MTDSSYCRKITLEKSGEVQPFSRTHFFLWHPPQARTRPPIMMLFTGWEIYKMPADSVSTGQIYFFLEAKPWLDCKFKLQPDSAREIPSLSHHRDRIWMGSSLQRSHLPNLSPQMSTDVASSKPHISLEIFELLREKIPTKFK